MPDRREVLGAALDWRHATATSLSLGRPWPTWSRPTEDIDRLLPTLEQLGPLGQSDDQLGTLNFITPGFGWPRHGLIRSGRVCAAGRDDAGG